MRTVDLCFTPASELARLVRRKDVSPVEITRAVLERIERVNPRLNAYCTVVPEAALKAARHAERGLARSRGPVGPLHGIPVSIKDLTPTAGIRTTWGSRVYEHHVPEEDALVVERLKAAGAIVLGKTNVPEFGAGAHTYNALFGPSRNPWDPALSAGGSSGGAAVALAAGMGPLAEGSDLGGSLRVPAAFCGVVGFRTTPGLVPVYPSELPWDSYAVEGPMARTVTDTALMLGVMAGPDPRAPLSGPVDTRAFLRAVKRPSVKGLRIAWSPDLGITRVEAEVERVAGAAVRALGSLGARLADTHIDLTGVQDVIRVTRGFRLVTVHADKLPRWREVMNPNLVANIEDGLKLTADDIGRAERVRTELWSRARAFFARHDLMVCPTVPVLPFPVELSHPADVVGQAIERYYEWYPLTYAVSMLGVPAISIPAGWTTGGLPVGLQIVGPWRGEATVLRTAAALEEARPWAQARPPE
jgi:amidase